MVVEHTVDAFERNPHIDEIAIVSNPFYISEFENIVIKTDGRKSRKSSKEEKNGTIPAFLPLKPTPAVMST